MVWATFEESPAFAQLAHRLASALDIPLDHPPLPHVTLSRVKKGERVRLDKGAFPAVSELQLHVNSIALWESQLNPQGALYSVVQAWGL